MPDKLINEYFEWLYNLVTANRFAKSISYRNLLMFLHDTEFWCIIQRDMNRAEDGIALRRRFASEHEDIYPNAREVLDGPCSVLEMMVALALRCEEYIMDDALIGNRTGQWFWEMIVSLGLGSMNDNRFDEYLAEEIVARFLNREYRSDGKGGLFTIRNCVYDLRDVEIWNQLCWYLDSI